MIKELKQKYHCHVGNELSDEARKLQVYLTELITFCYRLIRFSMEMIPEFYTMVKPEIAYDSLFKHLPNFDAFQMRSFSSKFLLRYFFC